MKKLKLKMRDAEKLTKEQMKRIEGGTGVGDTLCAGHLTCYYDSSEAGTIGGAFYCDDWDDNNEVCDIRYEGSYAKYCSCSY